MGMFVRNEDLAMDDDAKACPMPTPNLEINPVPDGYIVYQADRDRVHHLNATAAILMDLCNGRNTEADMPELVRLAFNLPAPPVEEVRECLRTLRQEGLIE
jgi:hypothetical protein